MSDDDLLERLLEQERRLRFDRFTNDDAIDIGLSLVALARTRGLAITVDVRRGLQQLFHCALEGTSADNDRWVERKVRVVERFGHSSYYMGRAAAAAGVPFATKHLVDDREFAAHGGAFPVIVRDVGLVGVITVSGLPQADDHALVVEALESFLA
jgi:uncharacterized protein (UPF0303 family)